MLQYFLYNTDYGNTIVNSSGTTFSPVSPYAELYVDFLMPETQPYYLYAVSGGSIIVNSQENIDNYLGSVEVPPTSNDNVTYGEFTGSTVALSATTSAIDAKFNFYTGTTAPNTYLSKSSFTTYSGTTVPNTYYNKTQINSYTGQTLTNINSRLLTSTFNTWSGTTLPNTYLKKNTFATYTGTTVPNTYYNKTQINSYSAGTLTNINNRLLISTFNSWSGTTLPNTYLKRNTYAIYTGTTAPNTYLSKSSFSTYSGTTVPNTYYNKTQINSYSAQTLTNINSRLLTSTFNTWSGTTLPNTYLKRSTFATYTGTTVPNTYYNKTQINSYTGTTLTNINSRLLTTTFNTWSGTTLPNTYLKRSTFATYTGTTAPATFASKTSAITGATNLGTGNGTLYTTVGGNKLNLKTLSGGTNITLTCNGNYIAINASGAGSTAWGSITGTLSNQTDLNNCLNARLTTASFATYSGTTVPNTYYNKTQINSYTGKTNTALNGKLSLTGGTITGNLTLAGTGFLTSCKYCLGSDLVIYPIVGNQSSIRTYWGLQLRGYGQTNFSTQPVAVGANNAYSVVVITDTGNTPTVSTLSVVASPTHGTTAKLQTWQTSALATVASVDCTGYATFNRICTSGNISGSTICASANLCTSGNVVAGANITAGANILEGGIPLSTKYQSTITGAATTITADNLTIDRVLISNASGKVDVSSVTSADLVTSVAKVYGTEFQYTQDLTTTTTTSITPTYTTKITITTPTIPIGTYRITGSYGMNKTVTNSDMLSRIQVDGTNLGDIENVEVSDGTTWVYTTRVMFITFATATTHTITLQFSQEAAGTLSMRNATLELIRVS